MREEQFSHDLSRSMRNGIRNNADVVFFFQMDKLDGIYRMTWCCTRKKSLVTFSCGYPQVMEQNPRNEVENADSALYSLFTGVAHR